MGPRGLMDKASDFGSEDCEFESRRGRYFIVVRFDFCLINVCKEEWIMKTRDKNNALSAGFEPAREDPNGFLVHRLNHSATTTVPVMG